MRAPLGFLIVVILSSASQGADRWHVPPAGNCTPGGGRVSTERAQDASAFPLREGDTIGADRLAVLQSVLPPFVWSERDRFFYDGARLEVGPCFRDYSPPAFFRDARGTPARLGAEGELEGYRVGLPFPPAGIDHKDPRAGAKWLWNVEQRYQAAGFHGRFRLTDVTGGEAEPFEGKIFKIAVAHRADLAGPEHAVDGLKGQQWVAGGEFDKPFEAKDYAWRQFRTEESLRDPDRADDLHAYLPQWRRVRRLSAAHIDGLFIPSPAIAAAQANQVSVGAGPAGLGGTVGGAGGGSAGGGSGGGGTGAGVGIPGDLAPKAEPLRGGFEAFGLRPNLYDVDVVGMHDVLAPINVAKPMWPAAEDRDFGPSGLSLASDRWELRRALVLDARRRGADTPSGRFRLYVDLQTLQPLYVATYDGKGELLHTAIFASRWSEDRPDYPRWSEDGKRAVRVLDPVATVVAGVGTKGGWRRESWDMVSTPPKEAELRRMISVGELTRGQ
jgi:hypothetical protein